MTLTRTSLKTSYLQCLHERFEDVAYHRRVHVRLIENHSFTTIVHNHVLRCEQRDKQSRSRVLLPEIGKTGFDEKSGRGGLN